MTSNVTRTVPKWIFSLPNTSSQQVRIAAARIALVRRSTACRTASHSCDFRVQKPSEIFRLLRSSWPRSSFTRMHAAPTLGKLTEGGHPVAFGVHVSGAPRGRNALGDLRRDLN